MSNRRVDLARLQEMVRLHREGEKPRRIARRLAMSPNTERFYRNVLGSAGLLDGAIEALPSIDALRDEIARRAPTVLPPQQISSVVGWSERVRALVALGLGPRAIHTQLTLDDAAFTGSYPAIKRLCRRLRGEPMAQRPSSRVTVSSAPSQNDVAATDAAVA